MKPARRLTEAEWATLRDQADDEADLEREQRREFARAKEARRTTLTEQQRKDSGAMTYCEALADVRKLAAQVDARNQKAVAKRATGSTKPAVSPRSFDEAVDRIEMLIVGLAVASLREE